MEFIWYTGTALETVDATAIPGLLSAPAGVLWADLNPHTDEGLALMQDVFSFHPLAIEDTRNARQRPKIEDYGDYLFLILNPVRHDLAGPRFSELDVFVGERYVVTAHAEPEPVIDDVRRRLTRGGGTTLTISPAYIMYLLLDASVDSYFPVLDSLEETIEHFGDVILMQPDQQQLGRLFELKTQLVDMWRVVWPQREVLNNLRDHHLRTLNEETLLPYLRDIADHLMWIADMVSTFRDTLTSLIDLYMSAVSNRLNRVVNRLTIITVLIGVLTVIGGFYGMNFERTWPPFAEPAGVPVVIVMMLMATVGLLYLFRRLDWY